MPLESRRKAGNVAEMFACKYLEQQGLKLVLQNFYSRFGEIDLIMTDNNTCVFVEVKQRKLGFDSAIESITPAKQKKLILTAQYYLLKTSKNINCRFDVIAMDAANNVKWLKNVICL
ncbi:MAG: YraN family protein [Burkholderiales bacterium]|jgi:putative endonuclease|nr:YraN family protein [Burkholderiales bacterium]